MAFSNWSDLAAKMRDDLAKGQWRVKSYSIDGVQREFISPAEFLNVLGEIEARAKAEAAPYCGRSSIGSATR